MTRKSTPGCITIPQISESTMRTKRLLDIPATQSSRSQTPDSGQNSVDPSPIQNAKVQLNRVPEKSPIITRSKPLSYMQTRSGRSTPNSDLSSESQSPKRLDEVMTRKSTPGCITIPQISESTMRTRSGKSASATVTTSSYTNLESIATKMASPNYTDHEFKATKMATATYTSQETKSAKVPNSTFTNHENKVTKVASYMHTNQETSVTVLQNDCPNKDFLMLDKGKTRAFNEHKKLLVSVPYSASSELLDNDCNSAKNRSELYNNEMKNSSRENVFDMSPCVITKSNFGSNEVFNVLPDTSHSNSTDCNLQDKSLDTSPRNSCYNSNSSHADSASNLLTCTLSLKQGNAGVLSLNVGYSSSGNLPPSPVIKRRSLRVISKSRNIPSINSGQVQTENDTRKQFSDAGIKEKKDSLESNGTTVTTPNVSTKRKLGNGDEQSSTKRQKVYDDKYHWLQVVGTFNSFLSVENMQTDQREEETPVPFSMSLSNIIHTCLDETSGLQFLLAGLDLFKSNITVKKYPHPATLHLLMNKILMGQNSPELLGQRTYCVLMKLLQLHPPTTLAAINMYNESFVYSRSQEYEVGQDWNFIKTIISNTIHGEVPRSNGIYLLRYLVAVVEQNYVYVIQRYQNNPNDIQKIRSSVLGQLLWSSLNQVFFNSRCRDLLGFVAEVLILPIQQQQRSELLKLLMSVLGMAANICYLVENSISQHPVNIAVFGRNVSAFLHEVTRVINYNVDGCLLKEILNTLQPSWFCLGVCCCILGDYDDYLLVEGLPKDKISLRDIVTKYFYLLPKMSLKPTEVKSPHRKKITTRSSRPSTPLSQVSSQRSSLYGSPQKGAPLSQASTSSNTPEKDRLKMQRLITTINKKNFKGETALHTACIKNDVSKLSQLLKVPGVDVNVKDNAGWTPMHEACNHGRIQCVKELLHFVPAKTVDHYFSKDGPRCKKVDLLIGNDDGITPLHDAVLNNRQDICQLLLQHAGAVLLKQRTANNYTPLDLASDDDIRDLLHSFSDEPMSVTSSQESSQGQEAIPGSHLYEQVLGEGHKQRLSTVHECMKYVSLISFLIVSYINATGVNHFSMNYGDMLTGNKENCTLIPNEKFVKSDLKILGNMKKYLLRYEEHVRKICDSSNIGMLDMEFALLMCLISVGMM